jgi:hypothetical protein
MESVDMDNKQNQKEIIKAIETLTAIADLEVDSPIAVAETHQIEIQELPILYQTVHWLHQRNAEKILSVVRDTYRVILSHIKNFYLNEYGKLVTHKSVEGIRTIMVLVGEAAKKVDKYNKVFVGTNAKSICESKEFKDLVSFYQKKIAPIAAQETLSGWMLELPKKVIHDVSLATVKNYNQFLLDMDSLINDTDYDLFFLRKDNGNRFFDEKLIRNIKLLYDFDERYVDSEQSLLGEEIAKWKALFTQAIARNIMRHNWVLIDSFFKRAKSDKEDFLVGGLYKALFALMLAANQPVAIQEYAKGSTHYFLDFQRFLREVVVSKEFQHLIASHPDDEGDIFFLCMRLVEGICYQLFAGLHMNKEFVELSAILGIQGRNEAIDKEWFYESSDFPFSKKMEMATQLFEQAIGKWHHLSIFNTLDALKGIGSVFGFDTWMFQNLPTKVFDLFAFGKTLSVIRIPSPTMQTHIAHAALTEEFKAFLRAKKEGRHLLFNLQDRTSWKEAARSFCLEDIQSQEAYFTRLCVVSMPCVHFLEHKSVAEWIEAFISEMKSEKGGYFFPKEAEQVLFSGFVEDLAAAIHTLFFNKAEVLTESEQKNFSELMHFFIQLKLIESIQPSSISFTCKDGIDTSSCALVEFYALLKLFNSRPFSEEEEEYLKMVLHTPAILFRGRVLSREKFGHLFSCIQAVENALGSYTSKSFQHALYEHIAPLYNTDVVSAVMDIP